jgi:hypothetical protein
VNVSCGTGLNGRVQPGPQYGRVRLDGGEPAGQVVPRRPQRVALLPRLAGELVHAQPHRVAHPPLALGEEEEPGPLLVRHRQGQGGDDVRLRGRRGHGVGTGEDGVGGQG